MIGLSRDRSPALLRPVAAMLAVALFLFGLAGPVAARGPDGIADIADKVMDAVVNISTSQRVEAQAMSLAPRNLPPGWRRPDVLHLVPVLSEVDPSAFRAALRPRLTGLCAQGLVRVVGADGTVSQPPWKPEPAMLSSVDVVVLSEDDLRPRVAIDAALGAVARLQVVSANLDANNPPHSSHLQRALVELADRQLYGHTDAVERGMTYTADNQMRLLLPD